MVMMGSLLLAGNLLLAVPIRQNTLFVRNAEQADLEVRRGLEEQLVQKGLEAERAQFMVADRFGESDRNLAQAFTHFSMLFPEVGHDKVLAYVAERILRQEAFSFENYDHLVAMFHRIEGLNLTPSHYERLRHCALLNRSLLRSQPFPALPA